MKSQHRILLLLLICFLGACKKKDAPEEPEPETSTAIVLTGPVVLVTDISAVASGTITSDQGSAVTHAGICWDTVPAPDVKKSPKALVNSTTNFTVALNFLKPYTKYYVRAFASNGNGTSYGQEVTFKSADIYEMLQIGGSLFPGANCLEASGDKLYLGTNNGVFISGDEGAIWQGTNLMSPIAALGVSGSTVYAGLFDNSIQRSVDNGVTWSQVRPAIPAPDIMDFLIDGSTVYHTRYEGIYKSSDNGVTWIYCAPPLTSGTQFNQIMKCGDAIYTPSGEANYLYKSKTNGTSWESTSNINSATFNIDTDIGCMNDKVFFSNSQGLYFSTNSGSSWTQVKNLPAINSRFSIFGEEIFWCNSSSTEMKISADAGTTWKNFSTRGMQNFFMPTDVLLTSKAVILYSRQNGTIFRCRR